jgi:PhnB protein
VTTQSLSSRPVGLDFTEHTVYHKTAEQFIYCKIGEIMSANFKPDGYNSVSPYLIVKGASAAIDFLCGAFGAVEIRRFAGDDGKLMHAEVRIDDSVLMLADGADGWPPLPAYVHIYVKDVDASYQQALKAGAESVQEPMKKDDADKRGGVKDASGITWWIATKVE